MSVLDLVILGVIFVSVIVGLMRGFTKELTSIAAWVISVYLAFNFYQPVSDYLMAYINQQFFSDIAGGVVVFVVSLFLLSMVSYMISKAVSSTGVKGTDRVLGSVLGLVRGVLIISIFVVVANIFNVKGTSWWNNSQFISHFVPVANVINSVLPEKFKVRESKVDSNSIKSAAALKAASDILSNPAK